MKKDLIDFSNGLKPSKILCKETLNNRELIHMASGIDPMEDTPAAYKKAYENLGIDFCNRVPLENCPEPLPPGGKKIFDDRYMLTSLGLYDSFVRYGYPYRDVDEFLDNEDEEKLDYYSMNFPVPHPLTIGDIRKREAGLGDSGVYYCQLYTTLFMWGIEHLGWEVSCMAIALDPEEYDRKFLKPAFEQTKKLTKILFEAESPYIFFHDDIATAKGLVTQKEWLEEYIFPRYAELFETVHKAGKKVIFVTDGNATEILQNIKDVHVDGVMLENPATPFEAILDCFDTELVIGGIDTNILTTGTPEEVENHVFDVGKKTEGRNFAFSSCGGLHGGIPINNLEAYFDARSELGVNRKDWRN